MSASAPLRLWASTPAVISLPRDWAGRGTRAGGQPAAESAPFPLFHLYSLQWPPELGEHSHM